MAPRKSHSRGKSPQSIEEIFSPFGMVASLIESMRSGEMGTYIGRCHATSADRTYPFLIGQTPRQTRKESKDTLKGTLYVFGNAAILPFRITGELTRSHVALEIPYEASRFLLPEDHPYAKPYTLWDYRHKLVADTPDPKKFKNAEGDMPDYLLGNFYEGKWEAYPPHDPHPIIVGTFSLESVSYALMQELGKTQMRNADA